MMAIKRLFFSSQGKINRSELIIGVCAIVGAGLVLEKLFLLVLSALARLVTISQGDLGSQVFGSIMFGLPSLIQLYGTPVYFLLCIFPLYCLVAKRCRDRNRGALFAVLFTISLLLPTAINMLRFISRFTSIEIPSKILSHSYVQLSVSALLIWAVIELCFLDSRDDFPASTGEQRPGAGDTAVPGTH